MFRVFVLLVIMTLGVSSAFGQEEEPTIPGTIAYIGTDFNVYSIQPDSGSPTQLTDNAGITRDRLRYYQWPTWSRDGQLAYFGSLLMRSGRVTTEVYVSPDGGEDGALIYTGENEVFNYAAWSPGSCEGDASCRDLAVLLSSEAANALIVQMIRSSDQPAEDTDSFTVGQGQPFYYSFSPDGRRLLLQRNNDRLDIYDIENEAIEMTLEQQPGAFFAPAWSPVDDRLLFGMLDAESRTTDLVIAAGDSLETLREDLQGPVYFSWSPDGNYVAYTDSRGPIIVLDAVSGETVTQGVSAGVFAFFWSPNSEHIAFITAAAPPGGSFNVRSAGNGRLSAQTQPSPALAWSVMDVATGEMSRYGGFVPTRELIYLFTFFDQFAQSHSVWSPDSRYLVYSEQTDGERSVISLLDTQQTVTVPLFIADGFIGVWSYQ